MGDHGAGPAAGNLWHELSEMAPETGLVPFLLASLAEEYEDPPQIADPAAIARHWADRSLAGEAARPWDNDEFGDPEDISALAGLDPAALLAGRWDGQVPSPQEEDDDWLLQVGFARIRLLARRPPATVETARLLAAEHFAFCDECAGEGLHQVSEIAGHLLQTPVWTFWWD